ncbi:MAG: hypothetical protein WC341_14685 [Bacteroidales bacterium]|jgi:hypothetical protein
MNRNLIKLLFSFTLLVALFTGSNVHSQEVAAWSKIDTGAIMIGQQVNIQFGIRVTDGYQVGWPEIGDTLTSNIEVINKSEIDTVTEPGALRLMQQLTLTSFDSGYFKIPAFNIHISKPGDTTTQISSSGELYLKVNVPVVDTAQAIKPIVGPISEPYTFKELLPWILLGIVAIGLVVLLIFYLKRRKKKQPLFERKAKPVQPPHLVAINKLEELRLAKVWQSGKLKQYHSQITDIMREYLDNRFHFDAPEMTSDEILSTLKKYKVNDEAFGKLSGVLFLSDMVKFAKSQPTALENDLSLSHCVDFVNETKEEKPAIAGTDAATQNKPSKPTNN